MCCSALQSAAACCSGRSLCWSVVRWRVPWLLRVCHDALIHEMTRVYVTCRMHMRQYSVICHGVASIGRLLKIIGLFGKRALWKRRYSAKETYNSRVPASCSHPICIWDHTWLYATRNLKSYSQKTRPGDFSMLLVHTIDNFVVQIISHQSFLLCFWFLFIGSFVDLGFIVVN